MLRFVLEILFGESHAKSWMKMYKIMRRNGGNCIYCFLVLSVVGLLSSRTDGDLAHAKMVAKKCVLAVSNWTTATWFESIYRTIWCISLCRSSPPRPTGYNHGICMLWRFCIVRFFLRCCSFVRFFFIFVTVVARQFICPEVCADFSRILFFILCSVRFAGFWFCGTLLSILDKTATFPFLWASLTFRCGVCFVCNTRIYLS